MNICDIYVYVILREFSSLGFLSRRLSKLYLANCGHKITLAPLCFLPADLLHAHLSDSIFTWQCACSCVCLPLDHGVLRAGLWHIPPCIWDVSTCSAVSQEWRIKSRALFILAAPYFQPLSTSSISCSTVPCLIHSRHSVPSPVPRHAQHILTRGLCTCSCLSLGCPLLRLFLSVHFQLKCCLLEGVSHNYWV